MTPTVKAQSHASARLPHLNTFPKLLIGGLLYYALAQFGMTFMATQPANITLIWLSVGVALVMYLRLGKASAVVVFIASFAANYPGMQVADMAHGVVHTSIAALIDTLAPWVMAGLVKRHLQSGLSRFQDLVTLVVRVYLLPIALSVVMLTVNLILGGYIGSELFAQYVLQLLFSDILGALLVYAFFDAFVKQQQWPLRQSALACAAIVLALAAMLTAKLWLGGFIFAVLPCVLVMIFVCASVFVYSVLLAVVAALVVLFGHDFGPFIQDTPMQSLFMLQSFIVTLSMLTIGGRLLQSQLLNETDSKHYWQHQARFDDLTQLMQRNAFMDAAEHSLRCGGLKGKSSSIAVVDLDLFKKVNDRFGHQAGDEVLECVAYCLTKQLREHDLAARFGGEEFVLLLSAHLEQGRGIVERIRIAISELTFDDYPELRVTCSIGVTHVNQGEDIGSALSRADGSLYKAKQQGRNQVCINH